MDVRLERRRILVDGVAQLILAGEIHYFRLPREGWGRRLDLLAEAGATTVASYIPWVVHEQADGTVDLTGRVRPELDLGAFVDAAADRGLTFLARPGPFTMAELRHEGVPSRLRTQYPHLVPLGWDGAPTTTSTLDYLHPDFLAETRSWFAALSPVLAPRMASAGGPVLAVQLDNEIGMLSWVSNTPDLTDHVLTDFRQWLERGDRLAGYPAAPTRDAWADTVRSPRAAWAARLRVDLAHFLRHRFARYVEVLQAYAIESGFGDVPLLINVHGTEAGSAMSFPIGISQLVETFRGRQKLTSGSDHYLGTLTFAKAAELHLVHAFLAAVHDADQPVTSLEFEAGTGDYGSTLGDLTDERSVVLKTRLLLAQGVRAFNYYLFAGGVNQLDPRPDDAGTRRFGITGERHGSAAPVTPEGEPGPAYAGTQEAIGIARAHAADAAVWVEEHDDLAVGFVLDHWATEHRYLGNPVMQSVVDELVPCRGAGPAALLPRMLLAAGFRYGAVDLQTDPAADLRWPAVIALGTGRVLAADVQQRLLAHVETGGRLLLHGDLPVLDDLGEPCTLLADALGLQADEPVTGAPHDFPSVVGAGRLADLPELRAGRWTPLSAGADRQAEVLLRSAIGDRPCALTLSYGAGRVTVLATDASPGWPAFVVVLDQLGVAPRLTREVDGPGLISTTTRTPDGRRHLHLINTESYRLTVRLRWDGEPIAGASPVVLEPRSGLIRDL